LKEHEIMNRIRIAISEYGKYFRVNAGTGWTSNDIHKIFIPGRYPLGAGDIILKNARPFTSGVPAGYTDISGVTTITVTPEMVGQKIGVATFLEIKTPGKKPTPDQVNFMGVMREAGCLVGVASSESEALKIVKGDAT
jgi:hypothetical protein